MSCHRPLLLSALVALGNLALLTQTAGAAEPETYSVALVPLNHSGITGTATLTIVGKLLKIHVDVNGAAPDVVHGQHIHGLLGSGSSRCATSAQDTNHDGLIDVREAGSFSGPALVPLNADPALLDIAGAGYPVADKAGHYTYDMAVVLQMLDRNFTNHYKGQKLDLTSRVLYIHGTSAEPALPATVASVGEVPATVSLPVACGAIMTSSP